MTTQETVRKSLVLTFANHPPVKLWGEFPVDTSQGKHPADYADGCVWSRNPDFGFDDIYYYIAKSGKRLYWGSQNSGICYGTRSPKTHRTFLRTVADIKNYIIDHGNTAEWNEVSHLVDPALIVDSDLL
jgi:hypothetical protein